MAGDGACTGEEDEGAVRRKYRTSIGGAAADGQPGLMGAIGADLVDLARRSGCHRAHLSPGVDQRMNELGEPSVDRQRQRQ